MSTLRTKIGFTEVKEVCVFPGLIIHKDFSLAEESRGLIMSVLKDFKHYSISKDYEIGNLLGSGKFSVVHSVKNRLTGKEFAAKMIYKSSCTPKELEKEVEIMNEINGNPNVVHLHDIYDDPTSEKYVLILDLIRGGELFDKIVEYEFYSEKDAALLIYQVVSIVDYLHSLNIVHRDLKPENLLFVDQNSKRLKLCDFGLAEKVHKGNTRHSIVGSPTYMAPEILSGSGYDKKVDIYSIGVILYILLCGYPPFEPEEGIVELGFPSPEWDSISPSVKDLINILLDPDPSKRPDSAEILKNSWIGGEKASSDPLKETIRTMHTYNTVRRNPGVTMRHKDAFSKIPIFNIFDPPLKPNNVTKKVDKNSKTKKKKASSTKSNSTSYTNSKELEKTENSKDQTHTPTETNYKKCYKQEKNKLLLLNQKFERLSKDIETQNNTINKIEAKVISIEKDAKQMRMQFKKLEEENSTLQTDYNSKLDECISSKNLIDQNMLNLEEKKAYIQKKEDERRQLHTNLASFQAEVALREKKVLIESLTTKSLEMKKIKTLKKKIEDEKSKIERIRDSSLEELEDKLTPEERIYILKFRVKKADQEIEEGLEKLEVF